MIPVGRQDSGLIVDPKVQDMVADRAWITLSRSIAHEDPKPIVAHVRIADPKAASQKVLTAHRSAASEARLMMWIVPAIGAGRMGQDDSMSLADRDEVIFASSLADRNVVKIVNVLRARAVRASAAGRAKGRLPRMNRETMRGPDRGTARNSDCSVV
jgi:hypothetical protein